MKGIKITGKVIKVNGKCAAGHYVGEEFNLTLYSEEKNETHRIPSICGFLYNAIFPYVVTLQFNGVFPWEKGRDVFLAGCPDNYKVVVEIRRIKA